MRPAAAVFLRAVAAVAAVVATGALSVACLPGVDDLFTDTNLEVLVSGLEEGDLVRLDTAAASFSERATGPLTRFHVSLPAGPAEGTVTVERPAGALCLDFATIVAAAGSSQAPTLVALHADAGRACVLPPVIIDGRSLEVFVETREGDCGDASCRAITTLRADGEVLVEDPDAPAVLGRAGRTDLERLTADALSAEADRLFTDGCDPLGGPPRTPIVLTRSTRVDGGPEVVDALDVANCRSGVATRMRTRLNAIRDSILADDDRDDR